MRFGRQHFRFFTGLPIYGTRAEVPSRVSSRFSVPSIIAFPFRLEGPIAFAYYVKADIARAAAAASMLCAVPAMPNGNLRLRFALGALVCRLGVDPLCAERAGDFVLAGKKARKGFLIRTVPRAIPNNVRHVKSKPARLSLPRLVALPGGVAGVEVRGAVDKHRQKLNALRVEDRVYIRVAAGCGYAGLHLLGVLKVAAVRKADRQVQALRLAVKVFVVRVRVDAAEDRVLRLYLPAIWPRLRADVDHVASPRALRKAGGAARDDWQRRLVYAARLAVSKPYVRLFGKAPLVLRLEFGYVLLHQLDASGELFLQVFLHDLSPLP